MNTFPIITADMQKKFELTISDDADPAVYGKFFPESCGILGRACRKFDSPEGACLVPCHACPLAAYAKVQELREEIRKCSDAYYNEDNPLVSDEEFDKMMLKLRNIERQFPDFVSPDSPTQIVGGKRVLGIAVEHKVPMQSLLDVFSDDEVRDFVDGIHKEHPGAVFSVEQKIDGLSLSLVYAAGMLVQASTRGDGHIGEDVTQNAMQFVPEYICMPDDVGILEIRGEVYMSNEDFEAANAEQLAAGKKLFANPRNCAAGTLRQSDPTVCKKRNLRFFAFNIQAIDGEEADYGSHTVWLRYLDLVGFATTKYALCESAEDVLKKISEIGEKRPKLSYPIDGAVVKVDDLETRKEIGVRTKTPKWAIAYKYPAEEKETVLRQIQLQVGRTGRITPVAIFDPVQLAGTTVQKATLNNADYIASLDCRSGDTIVVYKSGDIIPQVRNVVLSKRPESTIPYSMEGVTCPVCGHKTARIDGSVDIFCVNPYCPAKAVQRLVFFASKPCMDMDGFGETRIEEMFDAAIINDIADFYTLRERSGLLVNMYGEKVTAKLLKAVENSKTQSADKVLKAIGCKSVGGTVSRALLEKYGSIPTIFEQKEIAKDIVAMDGIGTVIAEDVEAMLTAPTVK